MQARILTAAFVFASLVASSRAASAQEPLAPLPAPPPASTAAPAPTAAPASTTTSPAAAPSTARAPESPTVAPAISGEAARPSFEQRAPEEKTPARQFPAIGGHLGAALPIATFGSNTTTIGSDFTLIGLTPGLTVHLDEKWAIDFEFIAFTDLKGHAPTTFVVDPGIIRKFDGFVAGLRVATQVGAPPNSGLVPIVVVPFKIGQRAVWFLEADAPVFLRDNGRKAELSVTALFQTGIGF